MKHCIFENWLIRNRLMPATKLQGDSMMRKLITWSLFVFFLIQLSAPGASAGIVVLQPGPEGFDTRLLGYTPDTPRGGNEKLYTYGNEYQSASTNPGVSLLRFVLPWPLDDPSTTIDSATLKLYLYYYYCGNASYDDSLVGVAGVKKTWVESTATWNNFVTTPYNDSDQISTDTVLIPDIPTSGGTPNIWLEWNVTPLVSDWVSGARENYGFMVRGDSTPNPNDLLFRSSDYGTAAYRPILEIQFTPPIPEPGTFALAASGALVLLPCALRRRRYDRTGPRMKHG